MNFFPTTTMERKRGWLGKETKHYIILEVLSLVPWLKSLVCLALDTAANKGKPRRRHHKNNRALMRLKAGPQG